MEIVWGLMENDDGSVSDGVYECFVSRTLSDGHKQAEVFIVDINNRTIESYCIIDQDLFYAYVISTIEEDKGIHSAWYCPNYDNCSGFIVVEYDDVRTATDDEIRSMSKDSDFEGMVDWSSEDGCYPDGAPEEYYD